MHNHTHITQNTYTIVRKRYLNNILQVGHLALLETY